MAKTMDMDIMTTVMAIRIMEDTEATRPKNANVIAKMIIKATTKNKNVDHSINQIFQKFCEINHISISYSDINLNILFKNLIWKLCI